MATCSVSVSQSPINHQEWANETQPNLSPSVCVPLVPGSPRWACVPGPPRDGQRSPGRRSDGWGPSLEVAAAGPGSLGRVGAEEGAREAQSRDTSHKAPTSEPKAQGLLETPIRGTCLLVSNLRPEWNTAGPGDVQKESQAAFIRQEQPLSNRYLPLALDYGEDWAWLFVASLGSSGSSGTDQVLGFCCRVCPTAMKGLEPTL